jgi:cytidine deaminase
MLETTLSQLNASQRRLLEAAEQALDRSYNPYSRLAVGAALLAADGSVIPGTNFENASFSLTLCAERAAVVTANTQGLRAFRAIAVIARGPALGPEDILSPCGACRQVLFESAQRAGGDIEVILATPSKEKIVLTSVFELLPLAMGRYHVAPPAKDPI